MHAKMSKIIPWIDFTVVLEQGEIYSLEFQKANFFYTRIKVKGLKSPLTVHIKRLIEEEYVDQDKPLEGVKIKKILTSKTGVTTYLSSKHWYPDDDGYEIWKKSSVVSISSHHMFFLQEYIYCSFFSDNDCHAKV